MAQDNQPEQEAGSRKQEASEQTAEEKPDFEVQETGNRKQETEKSEKPTIPETQKPQIPQEENIPVGGPGDQSQSQPATAQTQQDKTKKTKEKLGKPIPINTPRERIKSSEIEDGHNRDILSQS